MVRSKGGAPRTVSLPVEDMKKLGQEMVDLEVNKHPDILHLSEWYTIHKMFTEKQWETFIDRAEFIPYYEQSLKIVGRKYLDKNSNVREGVSQRWQRVYFKDLRSQEDADFDRKLVRELEKRKKRNRIRSLSENCQSNPSS